MPVKILFIEENEAKQEAFKLCLTQNTGIQYDIIADFRGLEAVLNSNDYTHMVVQSVVKNESLLTLNDLMKLPLLVVNDAKLDLCGTTYASTKSPLSFEVLFAFLIESTPVSFAFMEEYAVDDAAFFEQLKGLMADEFKHNFEEIPALIENKNLSELKSRAHQLSSKFSMLDFPQSALLCKEIDVKILHETEKQLENMLLLLVDLEIALAQLQ